MRFVYFILILIMLNVICKIRSIETTTTTTQKKNCGYGYTKPDCDECGIHNAQPNVRIIGGKESIPHSWPSMVLILFKYKFYLSVLGKIYSTTVISQCGGSLLNRDTVLTAAHCYWPSFIYSINGTKYIHTVNANEFHPTIESMYKVFLGLHDNQMVFDENFNLSLIAIDIKRFIIHPKFNRKYYLNDIAIIKLIKKVSLNRKIQPACLPRSSPRNYPVKVNITSWAIGWGNLDNGIKTNRLYNVNLTIYNGSMCENVLPEMLKDWNRQICAGEYLGGKDTCKGDSGGPLFVKDFILGKEKYVLAGITSYGNECALAKNPG